MVTLDDDWRPVRGVVIEGYRVASGAAENSPYPRGTIELQIPAFRRRGLDLTGFFAATLNVSIRPSCVQLRRPRHTFPHVPWSLHHPPETFSFSPCLVAVERRLYAAWIYYPHPETKRRHHRDPSTIEIITSYLQGIEYGDAVDLLVLRGEVALDEREPT